MKYEKRHEWKLVYEEKDRQWTSSGIIVEW